jgi:curli biogenesis system outer membrane secretion channel CsgG
MEGKSLRGRARKLMDVLVAVGVLTLEACSSMPPMPDVPLLTKSSQPDSSRTDQQPSTALMTKGPKKRIAVMPFEAKVKETYGYQQVNQKATEMLTTALVKTGEFIVVERAVMDKVLKEQSLGLAGFVDQGTAANVGKVLGVQALVTGAVTNMGTTNQNIGLMKSIGVNSQTTVMNVDLDVRLIDTTTAAVLLADAGKGSHSVPKVQVASVGSSQQSTERNESIGQAVRAAADDVARKIVAQMQKVEWTGLIAEIAGRDVYINAGEDLGLKTGAALTVFRSGAVIKDPATGQVLGKQEKQVGQLLITQVRDRFAIAEVKSGTGFAKNDIVRMDKQ